MPDVRRWVLRHHFRVCGGTYIGSGLETEQPLPFRVISGRQNGRVGQSISGLRGHSLGPCQSFV